MAITITATDQFATEPSDQGLFTVTRDGDLTAPLTVNYTIGGTATNGTDYDPLNGVITIPAGIASALIPLVPKDNPETETIETVTLSVGGVGGSSATAYIFDNEFPIISLKATDNQASEKGLNPGQFTVSRIGDTSTDLTITLKYSEKDNTATAGSDYEQIPLTVTIPAGAASANINIIPVNDTETELGEKVSLTLVEGDKYDVTIVVPEQSAIVDIADNETPVVKIEPTKDKSQAREGGDVGEFTVTRLGDLSAPLTVNYTIGGTAENETDYTKIPTLVNFLAGVATTTINVTPIIDADNDENNESVTLTLTDGVDYNLDALASATVNIADNNFPLVTIEATKDKENAREGGAAGQFTVTRNVDPAALAEPLTVTYTIGGTAENGKDYTKFDIPYEVIIPANETSTTIDITTINDTIAELGENVIFTLTDSNNAEYDLGTVKSATVKIADDDTNIVTIVANDANASEQGTDPGQFTITRIGDLSADLTVTYDISGTAINDTDYKQTGTAVADKPKTFTVVIKKDETSATVDVKPIDDASSESNETVIVTLADGANYDLKPLDPAKPEEQMNSATVNIADNELTLVTIVATDPKALELGTDPGTFTVTRTGNTTNALDVTYTIAGTATNGTDYNQIPVTVTIPAGAASATIEIKPIDDKDTETGETVLLTLVDGGTSYGLGATTNATVNIADNDPNIVTVAANDVNASEQGTDPGQFTITRTGDTTNALDVTYTIGGTAVGTGDTDYTQIVDTTITIPAGLTTYTIDVKPKDDKVTEATETVVLTLTDNQNPNYDLNPDSGTQSATVNILDNDPILVSIAATEPNASEAGKVGQFTVTRQGDLTAALEVQYTIDGSSSAVNGTDYTEIPLTVTIPAGSASATIDITPKQDFPLAEGPETVKLNLVDLQTYDLGADKSATVTIADNDQLEKPMIKIEATDAEAAEEGLDPGTFTVTRDKFLTDALEVKYTIAGTAEDGTDYTIPATVTIPAGETSATIEVTPIEDTFAEGPETVELTLAASDSYNLDTTAQAATVTIADNEEFTGPIITIAATENASEEEEAPGSFTVSRTGDTTAPLEVTYTIDGTATNVDDYAEISTTVTIPAGESSATIEVTPVDDTAIEGTETVSLTLDASDSYTLGASNSATVNIADNDQVDPINPVITIVATDNAASEEGEAPGSFTVSRTGDTTAPLEVTYTIDGTATNVDDYAEISTTVTIPAGESSATIEVTPVDDTAIEGTETVSLTLDASDSYELGEANSATVNIADNDPVITGPIITIAATDDAASEPGTNTGTFTVTRTGDLTAAQEVTYTIAGTATNGTDYTEIPATVTIPAGAASATIEVKPIDDTLVEGNETVRLTLVDGTSYDLGTTTSATVTIADNEEVPVPTATNVFGGINPDTLEVGISGFEGDNTLTFVGAGDDLVDTSTANTGNNRIFAGTGNDKIIAGKDDIVFAGEGNDELFSNESRGGNRVYGGNGNDTFTLGAGDRLIGGDGDDKFFVGTGGDNLITGGEGADQFWIANAGSFPAAGNRITDFAQGEDVLGIGGDFGTQLDSFEDLNIASVGTSTIITLKSDNQELVTLDGNLTLTTNDFVFA